MDKIMVQGYMLKGKRGPGLKQSNSEAKILIIGSSTILQNNSTFLTPCIANVKFSDVRCKI